MCIYIYYIYAYIHIDDQGEANLCYELLKEAWVLVSVYFCSEAFPCQCDLVETNYLLFLFIYYWEKQRMKKNVYFTDYMGNLNT